MVYLRADTLPCRYKLGLSIKESHLGMCNAKGISTEGLYKINTQRFRMASGKKWFISSVWLRTEQLKGFDGEAQGRIWLLHCRRGTLSPEVP